MHPRNVVRILSGFALISTVVALSASSASAAPTSNQQVVPVASGSQDLGGFSIPGPIPLPAPLPIVLTNLTITASATWSGNITTNVGWDSDNVRQGSSLGITRSAPLKDGNINVTWQVSGDADGIGFGPTSISATSVTCSPALEGGTLGCDGKSGGITLGTIPSPIPFTLIEAELAIRVHFDITPQGAVVSRAFSIGGANTPGPTANPGSLNLVTAPSTETFSVPCTSRAGDVVNYNLSNYDYSPATTATQQAEIRIFNSDPVPFDYANVDIGPASISNPAFDLTGPGFLTSMGPLLANNVPPTVSAGPSPYSGNEGSPIQFDGTGTTSVCGFDSLTLKWDFSDGGVAFGAQPFHTFADNGIYSGLLTVTDPTGLSATKAFVVNVADVAPSVNAGPDTTAAWGRPVAFNGQAIAAGSADQSTLDYTWVFGDGSPSASGGASVIHSYAMPGDYVATFTVCDDPANPVTCASGTRTVHVTKRNTTSSYLGDYSGTFDTQGSIGASLVDQFGQPVSGRSITLQVGADGPFSASTNSSGIATMSYTPTLAGSAVPYGASANFAGDALYNPSNSTSSFLEAKKATTTTYTGATTGGPNKTVILSAVLKDATGKPLSGKSITFQLGTQGPFVVSTNASGIASFSLKLSQKNGTYNVSASYAGDASFYSGSSQAVIFKLQSK